jgi:thiol-disulfide isomerase/thioredoxin
MTALRFVCIFAAFAILCASVGQTQEGAPDKKIVMTPVKYDGLKQEILKHRGKVVVVDFWAHNCFPCRKAFPHFLDMHKKYSDKGLVVITVALEVEKTDKAINSGNKFLTDNNSPFRSLLLDEPVDLWAKQFDYASLPFYYVFDRKGKWVRYRAFDAPESGVDYDALEKLVVKMLAEK